MSHIFISYAHTDSNFVDWLSENLQDKGYPVWLDYLNLGGGLNWEEEIAKGIQDCTYFILVATPNAETSDYVGREIRKARTHNKLIIPLLLGGYLKNMRGEDVSDRQGIDFSGDQYVAFTKLVEELADIKPAKFQFDLLDKIKEGEITFGNLAKQWRSKIEFGTKADDPVGLLYKRAPSYRASAYLVGNRTAKLQRPEIVQVFLQFSGEINEHRFESYLNYIKANRYKNLWTILIRGPFSKDGRDKGKYKLDEKDKQQWQSTIDFTWKVINELKGTPKHVELYLNTPNAFAAALMSEKNIRYQLDIFNFNDGNPPDDQLYTCIYQLNN
jgi:hypothetical protein